MPIELILENGKIKVKDAETVGNLARSFYGYQKGEVLTLEPEEALYLMDLRNASCAEKGKQLSFNDIAERFMDKKFLARYMTYKDWRDRGLVIRPIKDAKGPYKKSPIKKYPSEDFKPPRYEIKGLFFPDEGLTIVDEPTIGKEMYEKYWLGQFGSYKAEERGRLLKLDPFETIFMANNCGLELRNASIGEIFETLEKGNPDFREMYEVYADWRMRGFVLKTGFKFGTHFRVYFPGASPTKKGEWVHSKHVIHAFPRKKKMITAEWARAIRVAHSVRKTFILAIPGKKKKVSKKLLSFLLYHRKSGGIETPAKDNPSYAMLSLDEDEIIGGVELANAIEEAKQLGLDLMLAIADRESSVTYYHVKRIELPGSEYEYYEIEWAQP